MKSLPPVRCFVVGLVAAASALAVSAVAQTASAAHLLAADRRCLVAEPARYVQLRGGGGTSVLYRQAFYQKGKVLAGVIAVADQFAPESSAS